MPHRRPKPSIVLGAVAVLAAASPVAVYGMTSVPPDVRAANESSPAAVAPEIAEMLLANAPDIELPRSELTALDLPDLHPPELPLPSELPLPGQPRDVSDRVAPLARHPAGAERPGNQTATTLGPVDQAGTTVKELTRGTPFSMVALTAANLTSADAEIRARQADGTWGPWISTEAIDTYRDDRATTNGKTGTEPIFVGETTAVQVLAAGKDVTAVLIDPGTSAADGDLSDIAEPVAVSNSAPKVISRKQWGADESLNCQDPTYDDFLAGATVHHTAGNNNYSKAESAGIVRAIYAYHARTLGWCDIGYNVLVDKYGQIFEGRAGGLDKPVQGAHAGGFNENTMGIAMMGDFSTVDPPQATINAVGKFLGWRLGKAGLSPEDTTTMYSEGTSFTPYPQGTAVRLPVIFAHRDVGNTVCPGDAGYARMDEIRDIAASNLAPADPKTSTNRLASNSNSNSPRSQVPDTDAGASTEFGSALPGLMTEILRLTDDSPLAQKWIAEGGDTGRLGAARSGIQFAKAGYQRADFDNGSIYTSPNGGVWTVLGEIYKTWETLDGDSGELGLPTSDEYPVPEGLRSDFEYGSLIFNELTGVVTKVLKVYNDTYTEAYEEDAGPTRTGPPEASVAPARVR